ncbi:hypothetical protein Ahy_B10g100529 isoform A [Arachis hypogaea]|uniref:50S ribosomal protein n=1 Tax=Arachis hypogaea TaxID=3818 RepID=A0A444WX06_ARAHY|nr:hypothetical protein Ahy_B10g100529 isoform A [Arachis hypogaea]
MNTSSLSFLHSPFPTSSSFPPSFSFVVEAHSTTRRQDRTARHTRIRKKRKFISFGAAGLTESFQLVKHVEGTPERPRLSEVAKKVGEIIAKSCLEKGITKVAFDRGGYPYHGRVQALADAAREHGLEF